MENYPRRTETQFVLKKISSMNPDFEHSIGKSLVRPIVGNVALVVAGFFLAPTYLLQSVYHDHAFVKWLAILLGVFISIIGMYNILKISVETIKQRTYR